MPPDNYANSCSCQYLDTVVVPSLRNLCNLWINLRGNGMNIKDYLLGELNREVERSRAALEQLPENKSDWKPHERSMAFGYLANMVANIPMWITMQINQNELDVAPKDGSKFPMKELNTSDEYVEALDKAASGEI